MQFKKENLFLAKRYKYNVYKSHSSNIYNLINYIRVLDFLDKCV
jgi:hypothetical protein